MSSSEFHSDESIGWLRRRLDQPQYIAWICMAILVACSWALLAAMSLVRGDGFFAQLIASLCAPTGVGWGANDFAAALGMWLAMTFAMMLPAGAPMLAVYLDISGAAHRKGMRVPDASILMAGYLGVWALFALAATFAQWGLAQVGAFTPQLVLNNTWIAGVILIGAGAWQFSETKHQCLTKCRRPMTWFMANWRDDVRGVFEMGLRQGVICLACCWALMLVMFVTGLMNLFWMAGLAVVMVAEKTIVKPKPLVYGTGVLLIAGGLGLIINSLVA